MILVVIVGVLWMVILVPSFFKRRSRTGDEIGSISHFHQQLRVLEQSAPPPIVAPAYRLRAVDGNGEPTVVSPGSEDPPVLTVVGADRLPRPALAFLGDDPPPGPEPDPFLGAIAGGVGPGRPLADGGDPWAEDGRGWETSGGTVPARLPDPVARQLVRRRRRDILGLLFGAVVVTSVIGFIPGAGPAWVATAVLTAALAGYVALLVHLRRLAEEREEKLRYLTPGGVPRSRYATPVSGRYAHPSSQAVATR